MGKIKTASVSVVVALLVIAVQAFYPAPPPVLAGSQTWYLTDYTTSLSLADYRMIKGSGNGNSDLAMSTPDSKIWVAASSIEADEAADFSLDLSGSWLVTLGIPIYAGGAKLTVEIGYFSDSTSMFTSCGTSGSKNVASTMSFSMTTTSHSIPADDYAAIRVSCTAKSFTLDLNGATSECYVTSPSGAVDYPGTATISFTVTDYSPTGLSFGSLNPGTSDNPEAAWTQNSTAAVLLTVAAETNVNCSIEVKGDNFEITIDSGSATGADSSTVLVDSAQTDLQTTVSTGDKVINTTDGSQGTVQQVDSNTQLTLSAALTGGNDNTFQSGDNYVITDSSASTIDISNAKWDTDSGVVGATAMDDVTYAQIMTSTAGVEKTQDVWYWLSIPTGKEAGDYVSMFYYQAVEQ